MKTRPIGERFKVGNVTLEVKEAIDGCAGCYYSEYYLCAANDDLAGRCLASERTDDLSVSFVKVEP